MSGARDLHTGGMGRLSMAALGEPIAAGRIAQVYAWGENRIVKLFREEFPPGWADYEAQVTRLVEQAGMRCPRVDDVVEVGGRKGIVYERLDGPIMSGAMAQHPWRAPGYARTLAHVHVAMHRVSGRGLPPFREQIAPNIERALALPDRLRQAALQAFQTLPDGDRLCHGDFHLDNILLTCDGPVGIDWITAGCGHPAADVARTYLTLRWCGRRPEGMPRMLFDLGQLMIPLGYLNAYRRLAPDIARQSRAFLPVMAVAKLGEGVPWERENLTRLADSYYGSGHGGVRTRAG